MKSLSFDSYMKTMRGCFLGKTIGGTLGMPYEGVLEVNNVTYYDPVPTSMVPNDDLDLQVINLELIRRHGLPVCSRYLSEFWTNYMIGFPDEYGIANHNVTRDLYPPVSGYYMNFFRGGMGAAIRSELWACLAPGDPDLAIKLALEDASTDHDADGVDACAFLTAIESAAFVEKDRDALLEIGFSKITHNVRMTSAFRDVIRWWQEIGDEIKIRELVLEHYPAQNWTDVTINLSFIILSWLASDNDFGKGICCAASLGNDADCTCATLGSIMGMLHPETIEEKWTRPIGNDLVLSPCIAGAHEAKTIDELMDQIAETAVQVESYYHSAICLTAEEGSTLPAYTGAPCWTEKPELVSKRDSDSPRTSLVAVKPLAIRVDYPEDIALMNPSGSDLTLRIANPLNRAVKGTVALRLPEGFKATPDHFDLDLSAGEETVSCVNVSYPIDGRFAWRNPMDILCTIDGLTFECTAGLILPIPYLLVNESVTARYAASNFLKVPAGKQKLILEVKAGCRMENMRFLAQGTRTIKLWLNGELISEHGTDFYVPAFHRNPDAVIGVLNEGWNRIEIELTQDEPEGEVFFGIADKYGWKWANMTEYRLPEA